MVRRYHLPFAAPVALRFLASFAWGICGLSLVLLPPTLALMVLNQQPLWRPVSLLAVVASALVGGLVAARRPRNPVGWLFLASACIYACSGLGYEYVVYALAAGSAETLLTRTAAVVSNTTLGSALMVNILPLYYPTGRLLSEAWRPVAWAATLVVGLTTSIRLLRPGPLESLPAVDNPLGVATLAPWWPAIDGVLSIALVISIILALASSVARYRGANGIERRQMQWLIFAASAYFGLVLIAWIRYLLRPEWGTILLLELLIVLAFTAMPLAAGVAIFRANLYAIDRLIDRALLYILLTGAVVGLYAFLVGYLSALLGSGRDFFVAALATAFVAALFQPLRSWLQRGVNRLLYGRRDDPRAVITSLGRQLAGAVAADEVLPTIVETLARELKLPYAAIMLDDRDETAAASVGAPAEPLLVLPLVDANTIIGRLFVAARAPEEPFSPQELRLLEDLARQAGVAVRAARLNHELQRSRQRLVAAREEERRRLQRDLHDELGPTLASMSMQLDAARTLLRDDPATSEALLAEVQGQLKESVATVRQIVHQLRPPILDQLGLLAAIRECALRVERAAGVQVRLDLPEAMPPLGAAVEAAAYAIVAEALNNTARHAHARSCTLHLRVGAELQIEIADDGVGLPAQLQAGVGLRSMRERAQEIGGTWQIARRAGGGTTVRVSLPLTQGFRKASFPLQS